METSLRRSAGTSPVFVGCFGVPGVERTEPAALDPRHTRSGDSDESCKAFSASADADFEFVSSILRNFELKTGVFDVAEAIVD